MAEYIEREKVLELAYWHGQHPNFNNLSPDGADAVDSADIERIPPADVAPVVHGRWIPFHSTAAGDIQYCSVCKIGNAAKSDFCPNCGAKMDGGKDNAAD